MLPSLTLVFTCGLAIGSLVPYFPLSISILLLALAIGLYVLETRFLVTRTGATAGFCCLLIGIVYWAVAVEGPPGGGLADYEKEGLHTRTGRIVAPVQQGPDRLVMLVKCEAELSGSGRPYVIRLTWRHPERFLYQGDRIRFEARLRAPSGTLNPGGFDYAAYLERQGIEAVATVAGVDGVEFLESGRGSVWWWFWNRVDRWRGTIRLAAQQSLSQPALGLFLGIIIGDRGFLNAELRDQFMVTGTVHLLSISGSHLGLVALLTFFSVRRALLLLPQGWLLAMSRSVTATRMAAASTVVPVTAYACLAGAELATIRSLVMLLVALIIKWCGYEQRMFHALALAALAILAHDPQALFDISFQLSFLSVCAIAAWLSRSIPSADVEPANKASLVGTGIRWIRDAVAMSTVVTVATIPLVAFYFNQMPWLGLFSNIVAVPVMGLLLVPLGLCSGLMQMMNEDVALPLTSFLQPTIDWFVKGVNVVAKVPGGEWHVASPSIFAMLVFYLCLGALWMGLRQQWCRWGASVGIMFFMLWWVWSPRFFLDGERFRVTFLDVGQGDSAVIEWPDGQVIVIDGGATYERFDMGRGVVATYLWNRGIRSIDHMIGTHPQLDHIGGLAWLLRHFSVKRYWGTGDSRNELFYQRLQQALEGRGLTEQFAKEGQEILSSQGCRLLVLNPPDGVSLQANQPGKRAEGHLLNDRSVVTELICGTRRILFAADVEHDSLRRMLLKSRPDPVDILKVPHHGALSSLNREWLAAVQPKYAVFSVGRHNPYGHPAPPVIEAYEAQRASVYRTDRDGGVWVTGKPSDAFLQIHRARDERWQPTELPACIWVCERANWRRMIAQWMG